MHPQVILIDRDLIDLDPITPHAIDGREAR